VREKARIAALAWLERKDIVADEALQPFHAIIARDAVFATVREVGESDSLAHSLIFRDPLAILSGHFPPGDLFKGRTELRMDIVEA
jgi:hypothetical protein